MKIGIVGQGYVGTAVKEVMSKYYQIKTFDIDILIDLTTIISHNRQNILDKNCAKVIIAYLAFPGTTGNKLYDYIM